MKKTYYLIFALIALLTASCDKALDKYPLDKLTENTFFETESGMLSFSNSFYTVFPGGSSLYLDNADNYFQMEQLLEARGGRTVPNSGSGWTWTDLRNYNTLLDNASQCKDEAVRTKYVAIARFFRAYFYLQKVKRFGDVPWIDTQIGSADTAKLYAPRDTREKVMQNVIADLDFAIDNLPNEKSAYTVTKWTAMALKSRACLFEGTYRKYHGINGYDHDWEWYLDQCASVSSDFIKQSPYGIYNTGNPDVDYRDLFIAADVNGSPVQKEIILARDYNATLSVTHNSNYQFLLASMGKYGMSRKTMASYLMKDGTRFTDKAGWQTMQFLQESADRDPRLGQTIRIPGYTRIDDTTRLAPDLSVAITGYHPIKFVTAKMVDGLDKDTYNNSDHDLILFRAAEVYLNYAEAKAEMGSITQDDLDLSIKPLRDRVGMPNLLVSVTEDPFLTNKEWGGYQNVGAEKKALILEIRRERTVELNQEGFRYYDLMRWKEGKIFEEQMWGMYFPGPGAYDLDGDGKADVELYKGTPTSTATVKLEIDKDVILSEGDKGMVNPFKNMPGSWDETLDKDYLYPIPTDELNLNTKLVQNPGW